MAKQKKLTEEEVEKMRYARIALYSMEWRLTSEGPAFWNGIYKKLTDKIKHRTSDGKPYVEPERWRIPTDEDAKLRPKCRVRDHASTEWKCATLVYVSSRDNCHYPFTVILPDKRQSTYAFCEILDQETHN